MATYPSQYQQYIEKINKRDDPTNFNTFFFANFFNSGNYYPYTEYSWVNANSNRLNNFRTSSPLYATPCLFFGINIVGSDSSYSYTISGSTLYPCWVGENWSWYQYQFYINGSIAFGRGIYEAQSWTYTYSGTLEECLIDMSNKFKNIRISVNGVIWDDPNPEFTWKSVPAINGKMGVFSFSTVKDASIGDGTPQDVTDDSFINRLVYATSLESIGANLTANEETEVMYAGSTHYMTITKSAPLLTYTFKLYVFGTSGPVYTLIYNPGGRLNHYIGFIRDAENGVAAFAIISKYISSGTTRWIYDYPGKNTSNSDMVIINNWLLGHVIDDDARKKFEDNQPNGGGDLVNRVNNPIPTPGLPFKSAYDSGFISQYDIEKTELQKLAKFLWSDSFIDVVKKFFQDPMQIIMALTIFPVKPDDLGSSRTIVAGGVTTPAAGKPLTKQWGSKDFGKALVQKRLESENVDGGIYFDYSPYTEVKVYLPYVGEHSLDPNDVIGKEVSLKYSIDYLSGACVAHLTMKDENSPDAPEECHYNFAGQMGVQIPVSQSDYSSYMSALLSSTVTIGAGIATIATGGLTAPIGGAAAKAAGVEAGTKVFQPGNAAALASGTTSRLANNVANMHPVIQHTSGGGSVAGSLSSEYPYIMISEPDIFEAENQPHYKGYPINGTFDIGEFDGFVQIESIHLDGLSCTENERESISSYLKNGVIVKHDGSATPEHSAPTGQLAVVFLKNVSDPETIGKTWTDSSKITGKLLYDNDIEHIKLLVHGNYTAYNYCYIHELGRYYFINTFIIQKDGDFIVDMSVDALQSFKDEILAIPALIDSAEDESKAKFLMNNGYWYMNQRKIIKTITFKDSSGEPQKFDRSQAGDEERFIISIAGDYDNSQP